MPGAMAAQVAESFELQVSFLSGAALHLRIYPRQTFVWQRCALSNRFQRTFVTMT